MTKLTAQQINAEQLDGWVYLPGGLRTRVRTGNFAAGLALVNAVGAAAEAADHHPDVDLRYLHVDFRLVSHDVGAVTERDVRMARVIAGIVADAGLELDARRASLVELALDSPDAATVTPFWQAVTGLESRDDELSDPGGSLPTIWFQQSGSDEPRQRWHPDIWVDIAEVRPRIDAAIAAGGTLVSDDEAPSFWVLADPEGNRVCLCTSQER